MGILPSYFKPNVNLFQGFTEDEIDEMGFMLYCAVTEPEILLIWFIHSPTPPIHTEQYIYQNNWH